ncbi:MAG: TDE2508 family outer membrane beta-barrel protein [Treponema sp.]|uniref:TDE2508 family outer membrane beta-barrel protein n=1 Tax=Treponema sp. TaxID=166 RepID=UPI003FA22506
MKMKMYISCILALMMTAAVWAVDRPEGPESPQKQATATLNGTEADQFMSLTEWSTVKFNKLFTYAGFARTEEPVLDLGVAFKAGPVYIGTWYQGNLGKLTAKNSKTVKTQITESTILPGTVGTKKTTAEPSVGTNHVADHTAAVLLGFGNMGVRLGYQRSKENKFGSYFLASKSSTPPPSPPSPPENPTVHADRIVDSVKQPSKTDKTTYAPDGYVNNAKRKAVVDFGMDISLGKFSLTPNLGLAVAINQDSFYGAETVEKGDTITKLQNITKTVLGSNKTATNLQVKLGTDFGLNDSLNSTFSFGYDFGIDIYGKKEHAAADGSKKELQNEYEITTDKHVHNTIGTKETTTNTFVSNAKTKSFIENTITLGYSMRKDFTERFSLFAGVEAPIGFNFKTEEAETIDTKTTIKRDNADSSYGFTETVRTTHPVITTKTTTFTLDPILRAAFTYAAIPERLFVSLGADVKPFGQNVDRDVPGKYTYTSATTTANAFTKTTETTTTYNDGTPERKVPDVKSTDDSVEESGVKTVTYGKAAANVNLGLRWNIIDAVSLDAMYSKPIDRSIGNIKLACTVKF